MIRLLRLATNWRPYAILTFVILLLLVDGSVRGIVGCLDKGLPQCPVQVRHG